MSSNLRSGQIIRQERFHAKELLTCAAWSGLLAGLVEATGLLVFQKLGSFGGLDEVNLPILWISPLFDLLLFVSVGLVLLLVFRMFSWLPKARIAVFSLALLTFLDWTLIGEKIRLVGAFFLAVGLAVAFTRWWAKHERGMLKFMQRTLPVLLAIIPLALGTIVLGRRFQEQHALAALPSAPAGSPNILLIIVDTLRSDHLSAYGYARQTSPHLDALARQGVLFQNAFATSSWTLPSHASLLTGRYPFEHGALIRDYRGPYPTLAEALRDRGYRTAGFSANLFFFTKQRGFGRGFLHFEDSFESIPDMVIRTLYGRKFAKDILPFLGDQDIPVRRRAPVINRSALRWIDKTPGHPFFVCLNYMDTHDPYLPLSPYRTRFSKSPKPGGIVNDYRGRRESHMTPDQLQGEMDAYDGAIAYLDDNLGQLFDELAKRSLDRNTLVVITSDHGEGFMEHALVQHKNALYREMIQVPLIFWWPGHLPAGSQLSRPVSNVAVPVTVTDLIGANESSMFPGASLAQLWRTPESASSWPDPLVELAYMPFPGLENNPNYNGWMESLISPQWHYILHEKYGASLYRWSQDPQESKNLATTSEGKILSANFAAELRRRLPQSQGDRINLVSAKRP